MTDRLIVREVAEQTLAGLRSPNERLAFWINTYNGLVDRGIGALGVRGSVWEVADFFDRVSLAAGTLLFNANEIEHGVLRGNRPDPLSGGIRFAEGDPRRRYVIEPPDPRIHFAISCGARSCPPVRVYHPDRLEAELDGATREFVNRDVAVDGDHLVMSPIFHWFRADFVEFAGGIAGFLTRHLEPGQVRQAVLEGTTSGVIWRDYDWGLQRPIQPDDRGGQAWIALA